MQLNLAKSWITNKQTAALDILQCIAKTTGVTIANNRYLVQLYAHCTVHYTHMHSNFESWRRKKITANKSYKTTLTNKFINRQKQLK